MPPEKSSIITVKKIKNGLEVEYSNGKIKRLENVKNPKNGSPVTFNYKGMDDNINGYIIEVWRIGKQEVLLNKKTGAHMEVGYSRTISPNKKFIFSSDCWEIGCYYQLNDWKNGKRLFFQQENGARQGYAMMDPIDESSMSWENNKKIVFEIICSQYGVSKKIKATLSLEFQKWLISPTEPCRSNQIEINTDLHTKSLKQK